MAPRSALGVAHAGLVPASVSRAGVAACAAGMPSASAPAIMGSVAAMLTPARTVARLDLMEPPVRFVASGSLDARHSCDEPFMPGECPGQDGPKGSQEAPKVWLYKAT
ncbi:hypothetical protein GCM10027074_03780 [Streptomyces deserti]